MSQQFITSFRVWGCIGSALKWFWYLHNAKEILYMFACVYMYFIITFLIIYFHLCALIAFIFALHLSVCKLDEIIYVLFVIKKNWNQKLVTGGFWITFLCVFGFYRVLLVLTCHPMLFMGQREARALWAPSLWAYLDSRILISLVWFQIIMTLF